MVQAIPEGYYTVTPYLVIDGASEALAFYTRAFGATELFRMGGPGGKIGHAEMQIGNSRIMLADEHPAMGHVGPTTLGGSPVGLMLYVDDVDSMHAAAIAAGAKETRPLQNQFYGDRSSQITDPFGHTWTLATHVEDVSPEEMERRMAAMGEQSQNG
jgi:PhnB protein